MNYDEENEKIRLEIKDLDRRIEELIQLKQNIGQSSSQNYGISYLSDYDRIPNYFEENKIKNKIDEKIKFLKDVRSGKIELLNESPSKRKMRNAVISTVETLRLDKIPEPPRHVSGRVYEMSDGCATWCMWFLIIDAIGLGLYYLFTR